MPQVRLVPGLRDICLNFVTTNFEAICYDTSDLSVTSLPASLLTDLLDLISGHNLTCQRVISDLLQPQLTHCRLSPAIDIQHASSLLLTQCPHLSHLSVSHFITSPTLLTNLVSHLPLLIVLQLEGCLLEDETLSKVGSNLSRLLQLNLAKTNVSDSGLSKVSRHSPEFNVPCPQLIHLNLLDTNVIPFSVYEFIVNHKEVQTVEYDNFGEVLRCYSLMNEARGSCEVSQLRNLNLSNCFDNFCLTLQHCPEIFPGLRLLSLLQTDLTRQMLDCVNQMTNLTKLELGNSDFTQYTVYFHEQVVPVLEKHGDKLTDLTLEKFKFVDIEAIGEQCPKLQSLRLSRILSFCNCESAKFPLLNLRHLTILNTKGCRMTEKTVMLLMTSKNLTTVCLQGVDTISDLFLINLLHRNILSKLLSLSLIQCHRVSVASLSQLVCVDSPLSTLVLDNCNMVREVDRNTIKVMLQERRLDLDFRWSDIPLIPLPDDEFELHVMNWEPV